mmetsp:Transcript_48756/g.72422  ORF Transcript_48756/g.72422 Transcript_48756/m.72422 type:complete len:84 (-) Transcript_48756:490-741(-)
MVLVIGEIMAIMAVTDIMVAEVMEEDTAVEVIMAAVATMIITDTAEVADIATGNAIEAVVEGVSDFIQFLEPCPVHAKGNLLW